MDSLVSAVQKFITWLQTPAIVCLGVAFLFAGYQLLLVGGENGSATAKKTLWIAVIGFLIVKGAYVLATGFGSQITF